MGAVEGGQSRKRVAFLAAHLLSPTVASGGDILFCELASRISKRRPDWEIIAIAPDFAAAGLSRFFERVVSLKTAGDDAKQGSAISVALRWWRRMPEVMRALRDAKPDLVHSTGDFFVDVVPVARLRAHRDLRWSGVVHHINAPPLRRESNVVVAAASYALQRSSFKALRGADSISVLNGGVRAELAQIGFDENRVHIVGAGIDADRFPVSPVSKRQNRAIWVNRLEPTKGMFDLPAIAQRLSPSVVIDVVGRGPDNYVQRLRAQLNSAGVADRVILHGFVPDDRMREMLASAAAFISCSYEEGWGISIAEALASGLPCVAYDLPSHREIFDDAIARVPLGDAAAFASAVDRVVLSPDTDELREKRHESSRRFSLDECASRQEAVFAALMV